jgi:cytidylate kinase
MDDFDQCEDYITWFNDKLISKRHNVVIEGPPGTGKSSLIETMCHPFGVQFVATADELKNVSKKTQFVVFDDFNFDGLSVDDVKRLMDRERPTQRIKVSSTLYSISVFLIKYSISVLICRYDIQMQFCIPM